MNISGKTRLCCLLGDPVEHSISPLMHNTAFSKTNIDYSYMAFRSNIEELADTLAALKRLNCRGFNLTMPLKTAIIPLLDELDPVAKVCNSVNTVIINDDGTTKGYTTDGTGYMDSLKDDGIDIIGKTMTILGAGGAATSIISQAAFDGVANINIFKRKNASFADTVEFAKLVEKSTKATINVYDMADLSAMQSAIDNSDILTNATNVGMGEDTSSLVPKEFLRPELVVSDIIYHPEYTTLLKDALSINAKAINGKYMLLFQGAAAFKIWTDVDMPVEYIKEKVFN